MIDDEMISRLRALRLHCERTGSEPTVYVGARVPLLLKELLVTWADKDGMTLSDLLRKVLFDYSEARSALERWETGPSQLPLLTSEPLRDQHTAAQEREGRRFAER